MIARELKYVILTVQLNGPDNRDLRCAIPIVSHSKYFSSVIIKVWCITAQKSPEHKYRHSGMNAPSRYYFSGNEANQLEYERQLFQCRCIMRICDCVRSTKKEVLARAIRLAGVAKSKDNKLAS